MVSPRFCIGPGLRIRPWSFTYFDTHNVLTIKFLLKLQGLSDPRVTNFMPKSRVQTVLVEEKLWWTPCISIISRMKTTPKMKQPNQGQIWNALMCVTLPYLFLLATLFSLQRCLIMCLSGFHLAGRVVRRHHVSTLLLYGIFVTYLSHDFTTGVAEFSSRSATEHGFRRQFPKMDVIFNPSINCVFAVPLTTLNKIGITFLDQKRIDIYFVRRPRTSLKAKEGRILGHNMHTYLATTKGLGGHPSRQYRHLSPNPKHALNQNKYFISRRRLPLSWTGSTNASKTAPSKHVPRSFTSLGIIVLGWQKDYKTNFSNCWTIPTFLLNGLKHAMGAVRVLLFDFYHP